MAWFSKLFKPQPPWERSRPGCLEHANASCKVAKAEGKDCGVLICALNKNGAPHAVVWIKEDDGSEIYWDAAWHCYRKAESFTESYRAKGPTLGVLQMLEDW